MTISDVSYSVQVLARSNCKLICQPFGPVKSMDMNLNVAIYKLVPVGLSTVNVLVMFIGSCGRKLVACWVCFLPVNFNRKVNPLQHFNRKVNPLQNFNTKCTLIS